MGVQTEVRFGPLAALLDMIERIHWFRQFRGFQRARVTRQNAVQAEVTGT
jgi:hypothetical protein